MTFIIWDLKAREFLRKLQKEVAKRIFNKVDKKIRNNIERYLERLVKINAYKIRIGHISLKAAIPRSSKEVCKTCLDALTRFNLEFLTSA